MGGRFGSCLWVVWWKLLSVGGREMSSLLFVGDKEDIFTIVCG